MLNRAASRGAVLAVMFLFAWPAILPASEIKLKNGTTIHNATILSNDATGVVIEAPMGGSLHLPAAEIASIDGTPVVAPPTPPAAGPAVSATGIPYLHSWRMEVTLAGSFALALAWMALLLWVARDARIRKLDVRRWNTIVLLLPVVGWVMYAFARRDTREVILTPEAVSSLHAAKPGRRLFSRGGRKAIEIAPGKTAGILLQFLDDQRKPLKIEADTPTMTGIETARGMLESAITERASDVHIEPQEHDYRVRVRVDGVLHERQRYDRADGIRIISALKTLAEIDVAEKRKAQDGRFRVSTGIGEIDFRVATTSSMFGEKMVLRVLDRKSGMLGLGDLGMPKAMLEEFGKLVHTRGGMILAAGPTGSGKTSTLYAALSTLDRRQLNVMTIEDPVEYQLEGATQIHVNPKAGVTYESGLRSVMRQDPDVILVGEMRDREAAVIAMRAALTGHLVFSSIHARDAVGTVMRLEEMGVEKYQISSALRAVVAQRLVRLLCRMCREPYQSAAEELEPVGLRLPVGRTIYRAKGCEMCGGTGYQGRTGIFEMLALDEDLRKAINDGVSQQDLFQIAFKNGFHNYHEDGADKILAGVTTVEEVIQAS